MNTIYLFIKTRSGLQIFFPKIGRLTMGFVFVFGRPIRYAHFYEIKRKSWNKYNQVLRCEKKTYTTIERIIWNILCLCMRVHKHNGTRTNIVWQTLYNYSWCCWQEQTVNKLYSCPCNCGAEHRAQRRAARRQHLKKKCRLLSLHNSKCGLPLRVGANETPH